MIGPAYHRPVTYPVSFNPNSRIHFGGGKSEKPAPTRQTIWDRPVTRLLMHMLYPLLEQVQRTINRLQISIAEHIGLGKVKLFHSNFLNLYYDTQRKWYFVGRPNADGVVVIVPMVKKDGKDHVVLLISQRPPLGRKNIIEFPAGLIGDQDGGVEDIETAAKRELLEETGLKVRRIIKTTVADSSVSSPGIATEKGSIVYVDCDLADRASNLDADGEVIKKIVAVEKSQVKRWLEHKSYQGFTIDASVMAALYGMPDEESCAQPFDGFVIYDAEKPQSGRKLVPVLS